MSTHAMDRTTKYCQSCGTLIDVRAAVCPKCGILQPVPPGMGESEKKLLPAVILCFVFGLFGAHRFYAGKIGTGVLQLVTIGGLGIWTMIDFVMLVIGQFKDEDGNRLVEWV